MSRSSSKSSSSPPLRILPLGGLGEVGMNMMVLECGDDAIIIDCGQRMPEEDTPGVDIILPDITHLESIGEKLRGIVITHGHEDHIGALPHLWPQLRLPIFSRELPLTLIREKLREFGLLDLVQLVLVKPRQSFRLGCFEITYVHVTHSIAQACALIIETPVGRLVHTADYRFDPDPVDGQLSDLESLRRAGDHGVLVLLGDSTNVEREGRTASEESLRPHFRRIIEDSPGAVLVGCFSSATHRQRLLFELAEELGRTVFVVGRSMIRTVRIGRELGLFDVPDSLLGDPQQIGAVPPSQRLILASGTQGEPFSAFSSIARGEHRQVHLAEGDHVILSARMIPGNERAIFRMINHLYRRGVTIHHALNATVHTSGHAYRGEMREMIELVRPRHVIPVHGEYRHLVEHARLAMEMGIPEENVHVIEDGQVLELTAHSVRRAGDIHVGRVFVDGLGVGDVSEVVLRDRKHLASDGMVVVIISLDRQERTLLSDPDFIMRGFVESEENGKLISECRKAVRKALEGIAHESREEASVIEDEVRLALRRHIRKRFQRRPMILPVIMEI